MRLNLIAPINTLSYGYVSSYILRELSNYCEVSLHPIGGIQPEEKFVPYVQAGLKLQKWFDYDAPCIRIFHQNSMEQWVGDGNRVAFPIFELNKFNAMEKHHLHHENVDQIFVCSDWAKGIVQKELEISRPSVVPLGVDPFVFTPKTNRRKTTVFFNCGKWEYRKGHDLLWKIFNKAFVQTDDVELWMMAGNGFMQPGEEDEWKRQYIHTALGGKVKFLPPVQNQNQAAYVMQQTDCGIFPTRAEGWGLPILEMMSCGKHVITTNYSGQTQF
jgi:glycosyltransferase involved in cell wall biosynthesis